MVLVIENSRYTLDTLKTRFQSPDYKKIYYDISKDVVNRRLLFRGLYQGVGSVILITIPSCKYLFTVHLLLLTFTQLGRFSLLMRA
jgi:hypothetical protein